MNLIAKPVVKDQYWIVTDGEKKVGNVLANGSGFSVKIGNTKREYPSTKTISNKEQIEFVKFKKVDKKNPNPYEFYPTTGRVFNSLLDVRRKIHLFTKTTKSKCYYAAGWFALKQGTEFVPVLCPKHIFVQRYESYGPFMTKNEAENAINRL
jgi:hypothetical protein